FFQAEDGIRDWSVTGVQTCALPILRSGSASLRPSPSCAARTRSTARKPARASRRSEGRLERPVKCPYCKAEDTAVIDSRESDDRSEERRVGKEGESRGVAAQ